MESNRAYMLYARCLQAGHGKFAGQIYKKYKDTFPGFRDSMQQLGFYAWHDSAADIAEGVRYVREQMIKEGSYQDPTARGHRLLLDEAQRVDEEWKKLNPPPIVPKAKPHEYLPFEEVTPLTRWQRFINWLLRR